MSIEKSSLSPQLIRAVKDAGYTEFTPIQKEAIPVVLQGKDVMGGAQTGTGKTAAFTLPLLDHLQKGEKKGKHPSALILVPTRELAAQVAASVKKYGKYTSLRSTEIYGGVSINPQITALRRGTDILIATPGRLLDHLNQKTVKLSHITHLVLDEADRMLDMGFIHDIKRVMNYMPEQRQTLLFSATFSKDIKDLASKLLKNPVLIEVTPQNTAAKTVRQVVHPIAPEKKVALLTHLIKEENWYQVLIFTRTKRRAHSLAKQLDSKGIPSESIHGDKSQNARTRALRDFKSGKLQALVATDIASRGIDIRDLSHVVNFQLPQLPEDYIHRIGRTGRAGAEGKAISLLSPEEKPLMRGIEKLLGRKVEHIAVPGFATTSDQLDESERFQSRPEKKPYKSASRGSSQSRSKSSYSKSSGSQSRNSRSASGSSGSRNSRPGSGNSGNRKSGNYQPRRSSAAKS